MTDSEQIREWYHEGVVLNHADRGMAGYEPVCNHHHPTVPFPREGGGFFNEPVHPLTGSAWQAYVTGMAHHGETMSSAGGVNHCRNIGTSNDPSLHAYLCACDCLPTAANQMLSFVTSRRSAPTMAPKCSATSAETGCTTRLIVHQQH